MTMLPRTRAGSSVQYLREWSAEQMFVQGTGARMTNFWVDAAYAATARWDCAALLTGYTFTKDGTAGALTQAALDAIKYPLDSRQAPRGVYINGVFSAIMPAANNPALPTTAYSRSASDPTKYVKDDDFTTPQMNPLSSHWIAYQIALINDAISGTYAASKWVGIFFDNLGWTGYTNTETDATGAPSGATVNVLHPVTGVAWTMKQWLHACSVMVMKIMAQVQKDNPSIRLFAVMNGIGYGDRYFAAETDSTATTQELFNVADVGCLEQFLRGGTASVSFLPSEQTRWASDLDVLLHASQTFKKPIAAITKLWPGSGTVPTQADIDGWHRFTLGSFALVADGYHVLQFTAVPAGSALGSSPPRRTSAGSKAAGHVFSPEYRTDLGDPLSTFDATAGMYSYRTVSAGGDPAGNAQVYSRKFSKGIVIVNPTSRYTGVLGTAGSPVDFQGKAYQPIGTAFQPKQADGSSVAGPVTSLTLAAREAAVLVAA